MENWNEIFQLSDSSSEVTDYSSMLKGIDAKVIVVSQDNSKLIAHGNTIDDIIEFVHKGVVIFLPPQDGYFAGSTL